MLVLSRKPSEKVMIGKDITVTILSIQGRNVRIGFDAPDEVEVDREEIFNRKENDKRKKVA